MSEIRNTNRPPVISPVAGSLSGTAMTDGDSLQLLQQTSDRAARMIEQLERDQADLAANRTISDSVKKEGLAATARMLDAARHLLQDAEAAIGRRAIADALSEADKHHERTIEP